MVRKFIENIKKHPVHGAVGHFLEGVGVGILITRPWVGIHPLRWGVALIIIGGVIELYPMIWKKR